ncbi:NRDE family protein [Bacillus andreraoultii]|uniref:NRDE family protein n=1 Tax=Bacillus andreraoultii TaxID=1499685 RepID=UPI0005AA9615|nr:NRDE family protein [Bacillus andreraoultii]
MCLILFAYKTHSKYPLIVAANRDEFFKRPTSLVHYWEDEPSILAGRDLEKLGTWMGVTTSGRFAALTNYRDPFEHVVGKQTRGELVKNALTYSGDLDAYFKIVSQEKDRYPGFNLIAGDRNRLYYFSNREGKIQELEPGVYGLSNHLLNTPWPKVEVGKKELAQVIDKSNDKIVHDLFAILKNSQSYPDNQLPSTGVSLKMERMLSPLFIKGTDYGTRSSTVMLLSDSEVQYMERVYQPEEKIEQVFRFTYGKEEKNDTSSKKRR